MVAVAFIAFAVLVLAWLFAPTGAPAVKAEAATKTALSMSDAAA
jgi:hypothetical protein